MGSRPAVSALDKRRAPHSRPRPRPNPTLGEHAGDDDDDDDGDDVRASGDAARRPSGDARERAEGDVQDADADDGGSGWRAANARDDEDAFVGVVVVRGGTDGGGNGTRG